MLVTAYVIWYQVLASRVELIMQGEGMLTGFNEPVLYSIPMLAKPIRKKLTPLKASILKVRSMVRGGI